QGRRQAGGSGDWSHYACALNRNRQELRFDISLFALRRRPLCGGTLYRVCFVDRVSTIFVAAGRCALWSRAAKGHLVTPADHTPTPSPDVERIARGLRGGDRIVLSRAITLIESKRADHRRSAAALMQALLPDTGKAVRVGITGAPGVGKSTLIDALGSMLTTNARKVAVLAVDPSSRRTGGSILADKTRMARLANEPNAFIRPSPSSGTLGGVAAKTRETLLLCEAAGYDVVLVETIGVGQSEIAVADMTDFFLVLALPGAGDELQALK